MLCVIDWMSEFLSSSKLVEVKQRIKCEYCEKTYSNRSNLQVHLESVHMQLVHRCPDCDATFADRSTFVQFTSSFDMLVNCATIWRHRKVTWLGMCVLFTRSCESTNVFCVTSCSLNDTLSTNIFELFTTEFVPSSVKSARNHSQKLAIVVSTKKQNNISFDWWTVATISSTTANNDKIDNSQFQLRQRRRRQQYQNDFNASDA